MCGARFHDDDRACRDCGSARPVSVVEPLPVAPLGPLAQGAVPVPVHVESSIPIRRRKNGPLFAGALVAVVGLGAGGWWMATRGGDANATGDAASVGAGGCEALKRLAGAWRFSTEVTAAGTLASSGLNGDYTLEVTVDDCSGQAHLEKTGYTARKFGEAQIQRGDAELRAAAAPGDVGHGGMFTLRDAAGKGPDLEISFALAGDDRLVGVWRQRGRRWDRTRLSGFLDGRRDLESAVDPVLVDQPCEVRCAVVCDAAGRDLEAAAFEGCTSACAQAPDELPTCGDKEPLPSDHDLALVGPHPTLEAACDAVSSGGVCEKVPKVGKHRAPSLGRKRFDGGFLEARFVLAGESAAQSRPRLALHTEAGWHVSAPLDGLAAGQGISVSDLRIHARHLSEGKGRRYVLGEVVAQHEDESSETLFVCRPDDPPRCVLVPTVRRTNDADTMRREVAPIPGHALAIAADDDAPPGGLSPGVYVW